MDLCIKVYKVIWNENTTYLNNDNQKTIFNIIGKGIQDRCVKYFPVTYSKCFIVNNLSILTCFPNISKFTSFVESINYESPVLAMISWHVSKLCLTS